MKLIHALIFFLTIAAAAQPLPIQGIAHVGYRVHDLAATAAWYTDVLGYPRAFVASDGSVFYRVGDEQYLEFTPGLDPGQDARLTHIALQTSYIKALRRLLRAYAYSGPTAR